MSRTLLIALGCMTFISGAQAAATEETIVGKLLTATLAIYEQSDHTVLTTVVRVNDGSYILAQCDLNNSDPGPTVELREAHALMNAHIFAGSGTNIEVSAVRENPATGFPRYAMKSLKMSIPGWEAYHFDCAAAS